MLRLLVALVVSAAISALSGTLTQFLPAGIGQYVLFAVNAGVSLLVITLLFASIFKVLPDAQIEWRDVWVGAFVTALLFVIGKFLIGLYLGQSNPGEAFGAAGSLALILVWVYYSALILFLGVEFTQVWARRKGSGIELNGAVLRTKGDLYLEGRGDLLAKGAVFSSREKGVDLRSQGSARIVLDDAKIEAREFARAESGQSSGRVSVDGTIIQDNDGVLGVKPDCLLVEGTPASGSTDNYCDD